MFFDLHLHPVLGIAAVLGLLGAAITGLRICQVRYAPRPEMPRKALHVCMGGVALSFPWLFDAAWPVVVLALLALGVLGALRSVERLRRHAGAVVHGVERASWGDVLFPVAIALLFLLTGGDPLRYGIPVLILSAADPLASLVGLSLGRTSYRTLDGTKSVEGSLAFFVAAFGAAYLPLLMAGVDVSRALLMALIAGLVTTLIEAASWHGLDNFSVPLASFVVLYVAPALSLHMLAMYGVGLAVLSLGMVYWLVLTASGTRVPSRSSLVFS